MFLFHYTDNYSFIGHEHLTCEPCDAGNVNQLVHPITVCLINNEQTSLPVAMVCASSIHFSPFLSYNKFF